MLCRKQVKLSLAFAILMGASAHAATFELLAKAPVDECYAGVVGLPSLPVVRANCPLGIPKRNGSYVWGLARTDDALWLGIGPNILCYVLGAFGGPLIPITVPPVTSARLVCEFEKSASAKADPTLGRNGDWRRPGVYQYVVETGRVIDRTPPNAALGHVRVAGYRSAGAYRGVVFVGGPIVSSLIGQEGGVMLLAYRADTGALIGAHLFTGWADIRKWVVGRGGLYTGVGLPASAGGGGQVLRWTGDVTDPFQFEVVGRLGLEPSNLAFHDHRLFATTWPQIASLGGEAMGLYMSPRIGARGLTAADAGRWTRVWGYEDYEPDPLTAATGAGGDLASYRGRLYWGSMHIPFTSTALHVALQGTPVTVDSAIGAFVHSERATAVFRGRWFGSPHQRIELLYGEETLPTYDPVTGWTDEPNRTGPPLFGKSGFGNRFNAYAWTMAVFRRDLYVGTFDSSIAFAETAKGLLSQLTGGIPIPGYLIDTLVSSLTAGNPAGGDLWRFDDSRHAAFPIALDGYGNPTNYGARTMLATTGELFIGTANPFNVANDDPFKPTPSPVGGWELLRYVGETR